jgi:geranylgeranyl pyrophosphate synthase
MEKYQNIINDFINSTYIHNYPIELQDKIKYLLNDGKKLRPILCLCFSNIGDIGDNIKKNNILHIACAIEIIHCISLVLDDLPEMDNDIFRRGKTAFHLQFGLEYTNFFIYYILNKLFILNNIPNIDEVNIKYVKDIMHLFKYNINNLIDGQYIDMEYNLLNSNCNSNGNSNSNSNNGNNGNNGNNANVANGNNANVANGNTNKLYNTIINIILSFKIDNKNDKNNEKYNNIILNLKKTGTLFALSSCVGYILQLWNRNIDYTGNEIIQITDEDITDMDIADIFNDKTDIDNIMNKLTNCNIFNIISIWGYIFGFIFQISDDILDYESDLYNNKPNMCIIIGTENAITLFTNGCKWLKNMLKIINKNSHLIWKLKDTPFIIDTDTINQLIDKIYLRVL